MRQPLTGEAFLTRLRSALTSGNQKQFAIACIALTDLCKGPSYAPSFFRGMTYRPDHTTRARARTPTSIYWCIC